MTAAIKTYGITADQAGHDVDVQAHAREIVNKLQQTLGSGYAGVWFDMHAGKFMIDVAPSTDNSQVAQVESYFGIAADSEQVPVTYTWDQLSTVQAQWQPRAAALPASDVATVGISAQDNAVVVSIAANAPTADANSLATSIAVADANTAGPPVKFVRSTATRPPSKTSCSFARDTHVYGNPYTAYCDAPLRGGIGLNYDRGGYRDECTSGFLTFVPWANGGAGGYDMMTAGHCVLGSGDWGNWYTYQADHRTLRWIGNPDGGRAFVDSRGDAALLSIRGPYFCFTFSGGWCNGSNAGGYNVEFAVAQLRGDIYNENAPIYGAATSYQNAPECFNGRYDTTTCGFDDPNNYGWVNITVGGTGHSTFNQSCATGGDSGSAVYWGNMGYGIVWGQQGNPCPSTDGMWYTEVHWDLAAFGLNDGDI